MCLFEQRKRVVMRDFRIGYRNDRVIQEITSKNQIVQNVPHFAPEEEGAMMKLYAEAF